jgi:hypothetical protein
VLPGAGTELSVIKMRSFTAVHSEYKSALCGHVPAAHHAQLRAQSVTCCMPITTAFCVDKSRKQCLLHNGTDGC